ncbi:MAG: carboxypeptidase-like regulatory domain-containing protein, partial [Candidatus Acidiferrales bacterium]
MRTRALLFSIGVITIIFLACGLASVSLAQTTTGAIHGQVTDPSAAAVVGASVIVTTPDGKSLAATTNRDGVFEVK